MSWVLKLHLQLQTNTWLYGKFLLKDEFRVTTMLVAHPSQDGWAVKTKVEPLSESNELLEVDVLLVQDIGLNSPTVLRMNEAYNSHYIDLKPIPLSATGDVVVCARQNQATGDAKFPWVIMGCAEGVRHYATDGFQVFGSDYAVTRRSLFEQGQDLPSEVLQYEMSMIALQSERASLQSGAEAEFTFTAVFVEDHPQASGRGDVRLLEALLPLDWLPVPAEQANDDRFFPVSIFDKSDFLHGKSPVPADLERWYGSALRLLRNR